MNNEIIVLEERISIEIYKRPFFLVEISEKQCFEKNCDFFLKLETNFRENFEGWIINRSV